MPWCSRHTVRGSALLIILCLGWTATALGLDHVTLRHDGQTIKVEGRVLVTAEDGGMLVQRRDGILWEVQPDVLVKHTRDDGVPFEPLSADELVERLLPELPAGFQVHRTKRYVILYNTSPAYAKWCGSLFERLYKAFTGFWTGMGIELSEPELPLVAIVFADKQSFVDFSRAEVGDAIETIIGYYNLRTNRMVMYDVTGIEAFNPYPNRISTAAQINRVLAQPKALETVATIVHEATHQIAFNCGLQTRYSDCPLWVSEGIAVFFETPDLRSRRGWRGVGDPNWVRLERFRDYLRRRPANSLVTLLSDDTRLANTATSEDAYAEAWALTYFLINVKQYRDRYLSYLRSISRTVAGGPPDGETRLKHFRQAFGDLEALEADFVRYLTRLR